MAVAASALLALVAGDFRASFFLYRGHVFPSFKKLLKQIEAFYGIAPLK